METEKKLKKLNSSEIKDIFFDLDHTLYDFETNAAKVFASVFNILELENLDVFLNHYKIFNQHYWNLYACEKIEVKTLRFRRLFDSFKAASIKVIEKQILFVSDFFQDNLSNHSQLIPDAQTVLKHLSTNYQLHLITNGPKEIQYKKLKNTKLESYFKTVTCSEDVGKKKPDSKIFTFALNQANAIASKSVMIGDDFQADILGAKHSGLHAIYFNPNLNSENDGSFIEIKKLLELTKIFIP